MEIERKWLTQGWPQGQPDRVIEMEQGYISVSPTVRIRSHRETGKADRYVLCFKSKGGLVRQEIETDIDKALFDQLRDFIGKPLVKKVQRRYNLPGGLVLEANQVDPGQPTGFSTPRWNLHPRPTPWPGSREQNWPTICKTRSPTSPARAWGPIGCAPEESKNSDISTLQPLVAGMEVPVGGVLRGGMVC